MNFLDQVIEYTGRVGLVIALIAALLLLRAIAYYSFEFIGHSLKRPRFFPSYHPPRESAVYYVKTREGTYEIVLYNSSSNKWHNPEDFSEVNVFLWSYLPTTKLGYAPFKTHDEALEDAHRKEVGTYSEALNRYKAKAAESIDEAALKEDAATLKQAEGRMERKGQNKAKVHHLGRSSGKSSGAAKTGNYSKDKAALDERVKKEE